MTLPPLDTAELIAATPEVARFLLGEPNPKASRAGEMRYGTHGSLSVDLNKATFRYHETGEGGGLLDLIARERRCTRGDAVNWLREMGFVSSADGAPASRRQTATPARSANWPTSRPDDADRTRRALALWNEAVSAEATIAERYLASRGVALPAEPSRVVRYMAACPFGNGQRLPCMVALMRDPLTGEPVGIHRTALTPEARKIDRKMLGRAGAIMLSRSDDVTHGLGIAEGIETALSVLAAGWAPVWAIGSAGGIASFPVLPGIEALTVFADADEPGQNAARAIAERYADAGREAFIQTPPEGDFNDRLQGSMYA
ncbi:toprim domain-containing protein [Sphingosinicella sp.]|uniref:DUF7146 domain-containing protein n=1 Tax=Sphingosinicella sp. TaxID=1917971 RepID=UPI0025E2C9AD|nr:toprim domain-containing protein [Sphingosinicella sp.]